MKNSAVSDEPLAFSQTHMNRKIVFVTQSVSDEVVKGAVIAIQTENSWHIYGRKSAHSFDLTNFPMPEGLTCPILNIAKIPEQKKFQVVPLMDQFKSRALSVAELRGALKELGAREV